MVIVQRVLPHYRVPFFDALNSQLQEKGVSLLVLYGQEKEGTVPVTAKGSWSWAKYKQNKYLEFCGREFVWQPCFDECRSADLVIVEQANRLLLNYLLLVRRATVGCYKLAYFGHGKNFQVEDKSGVSILNERIKRLLLNSSDWWFAYTSLSAKHILKEGISKDKLTIFDNTIDSSLAMMGSEEVTLADDVDFIRSKYGIIGDSLGVFCGGMYSNKRLPFLIGACEQIKKEVPSFEMIFIGSGPEQYLVEEACSKYPWMHYAGPVYGKEKAAIFEISRIILMPGLVGLVVVDSFVSERPMITSNISYHSPEIAYLEHGRNGWIAEDDIRDYVRSSVNILLDSSLESELKNGCRISAQKYTMENMVEKFSSGILQCLGKF